MSISERETTHRADKVHEVEGEIREFVRRDVASLRRNPETDSHQVANNISSLLQRVAGTSVQEIDQLPTIDDALPGYEASVWAGVGVPRGTPGEVIERLNREINAGLVSPTIKARLTEVATTPKIFTPPQLGAYVAAEIEKWGRVIKFAGIRAE